MPDSTQLPVGTKKFTLGPLGTLNQVLKALGKTIRAMADGSIDSQVGARICNGLGIMRGCIESQTLERLEERMQSLNERVSNRIGAHHRTEHRHQLEVH
jgi:hypothetical protein